MENSNLPKQLSACDILKETTAKELASRNLRVSFSDEVKALSISDSAKLNQMGDTFNEPTTVKKEEKPNICQDLKEETSAANVLSSEYGFRASTMRSKIEEKISEIEEKINLPNIDSSSESLDVETSPPDYNTIKVMDARRSRSCSVSEMRQSTIDRLQSKLEKAEKDLELKEEEVSRLRKIRDEVGFEIEDLTASLFEEANNMVKNAHIKQHKAEKNAKEANMKLTMLQEEVRALKSMVQSVKTLPMDGGDAPDKRSTVPQRETYEVDPIFNKEFVAWRQNPSFDKESPFFKRIYEEDIYPCLNFANSKLSEEVLSAIENDKIVIEKISCSKNERLPKLCALMDAPRLCPYRMYLDGKDTYSISALSRNRITSICDLFCYFRYIEKGFVSQSVREVYLEVLKKRRRIISAKLGLIDDMIE